MLSTPVRVMVRPFRTYAALRTEPAVAFAPVLRLLLVIGATVALTATARLAPFELVSAMVSFAWIPAAQAAGLRLALLAFARTVTFRRGYALYAQSLGPMLLLFLGLSALAAFDIETRRPFQLVLMPGILLATVWSTFLTAVMFRVALALSWARAVGGALVQLVGMYVVILGYFFAAGQLWPIVR